MSRNSKNKNLSGRSLTKHEWFGILVVILCCLLLAGTAWAGTAWLQRQKLTASDGAADDGFSCSVSISGDYAIIGAIADDDWGSSSGSAYIFRWDGIGWVQQQKLTAEDYSGCYFGCSVSISGDYAIIGAYGDSARGMFSGSAYIFRRDGESWSRQAKLTASDGAAYDFFGYSVSISGDYAIIGAISDEDWGDYSGSAYIFRWDGTGWVQQQKLTASDGAASDEFGCSVSISGDYAIVGASHDDDKGTESGSAYMFRRDGESWSQQQKLLASDGAAYDWFGYSVSISGDKTIVGMFGDDDRGSASGSAYIFKRDEASWVQQQKFTAADGAAADDFGWSVSINGDYAIVGAWYDDDKGTDSGSAYIFKLDGADWVQQQKLTASDGAAYDYFGYSVSISGNKTIVGAIGDDVKGSAYIFESAVTGILTVLTPNGGENLVVGSTYDITWDTNGVVENVFIEYSADNSGNWTAIDTVANTGSYEWLVPNVNSDQCLVWISDADYPPAGDISNDVFRICVSTLTVLTPNGGEKLVAGSTYDITWGTNCVVEDVFIEYSADNGQSWTPVNPPNVGNAGTYEWTVPNVTSEQCLVQISDMSNPNVNDISDDVFRIYVCADWLTADLSSNCCVDFMDFAILGGQWFQTPGVPSADIAPEDGDGVVDFLDLGVIVDQWLKCGDPCDPNCQP